LYSLPLAQGLLLCGPTYFWKNIWPHH
jgi:hypothetical protein